MNTTKKIMQINCFFRYGSTGRLVGVLHDGLLARRISSVVCYARRPVPPEPGVFRVSNGFEQKRRALFGRLFGGDESRGGQGTRRIFALLRQERPDVVHLHVLNGHFVNAVRLLSFLGRENIATVLTLHAEQPYTAGCDHACACTRWERECRECSRVAGTLSRLWRDDARRTFGRLQQAYGSIETLTVVGVSPWVTERASRSPFFVGRRMLTVLNGVDTEAFRPRPALSAHLRRRWGISPDGPVLLHVTPRLNHPIKGGRYVFDVFEQVLRRLPGARLVIVGWDGEERTLPPGYTLSEAVRARLTAVAHTTDAETLAGFYTMADVTLLTGRRETFSMVCAESLSCGTPVAGFEAGGPESIAPAAYSRFVPQEDTDALAEAVLALLSAKYDRATVASVAADRYAAERMVEEYMAIYGVKEGNVADAEASVRQAICR